MDKIARDYFRVERSDRATKKNIHTRKIVGNEMHEIKKGKSNPPQAKINHKHLGAGINSVDFFRSCRNLFVCPFHLIGTREDTTFPVIKLEAKVLGNSGVRYCCSLYVPRALVTKSEQSLIALGIIRAN